MNEQVIVKSSRKGKLSTVRNFGALVKKHVAGIQKDLPLPACQVHQGQGPRLVNLLEYKIACYLGLK